jgi:putative ABC transport system permease protein
MFNTLTITLLEKTREIGFMKAMGTTRKDINKLFFAEAFLIGFFGGASGLLGGYAVGTGINNWVAKLAQTTGNKAVEIFYMPIDVIAIGLIVSVAVSVLTGFYPSFRAARTNALDALRYE